MDFSCIMPTRERPELLKQCIESFFSKATRPDLVEFWLAFDIDDDTNNDLDSFILENKYNVNYIKVPRSNFFHRDYHNRLIKLCSGKYIVGLNDECEIVQRGWDDILREEIENFLVDKEDRICYVYINDSTHQGNGTGCCFPIFTKESCEVAGCYIPSEISMWGGDLAVFQIYKKLRENRILEIQHKIQVLHHSYHNGTREKDAHSDRIRSVTNGVPIDYNHYINKINRVLKSKKPNQVQQDYDEKRFIPVDISKIATACTLRPFIDGKYFESIRFNDVGIVHYKEIPFFLLDYSEGKNVIALYAAGGKYSSKFPTKVEIPCGEKIARIHLLGLTAGWGFQGEGYPGGNDDKTVSMKVDVKYAKRTKTFELINGLHITDFWNKQVFVPDSEVVTRSTEGNPIRFLTLNLLVNDVVESLEISKGLNDRTCPLLFGVTFERLTQARMY